jgi:ketosteroid isomerase-like protein
MQQSLQRVGENPVTRMVFTMLPSSLNAPAIGPVDEQRRLETVAAEVQRRRAIREGAAPQVLLPNGAVRSALIAVPPSIENTFAAVKAADAERVAAMQAGDGARLDAIFSDDLRYAHSSGHVDTKASYMKALTSHATVYETYDYKEQNFSLAAPGVVLMTGHVLIHSRNASGANDLDLNFLGVWREEQGKWRFLAWQSCKNPPPTPAAKP